MDGKGSMVMELLHKASHLEITHDPVENILFCRWLGFQQTQEIMNSGGRILAYVRQKGICRVLNDNLQVKGPWQDAARWAAKEWFPEMVAAGLKHFAWILSADVFAEISAEVAMKGTDVVRTFRCYHEAYQWLLAQH